MSEVPRREAFKDFWSNIDSIKKEVEANSGEMTVIVHPTWQTRAVGYTERYYAELDALMHQQTGPKILLYEPDSQREIQESIQLPKVYGIQTVEEADAKPLKGWETFHEAIRQIGPKTINLVGQNINFWTNISTEQTPQSVIDFNNRHRKLLDTMGARGKIARPVQCLGSLWLNFEQHLPEVSIRLTPAVHPLYFIDFQDRSESYEANFAAITQQIAA